MAEKVEEIVIDENTGYQIKLMEFDKRVAEAKKLVADIELQKATFIYESNFNTVVAQHRMQQPPPQAKKNLASADIKASDKETTNEGENQIPSGS